MFRMRVLKPTLGSSLLARWIAGLGSRACKECEDGAIFRGALVLVRDESMVIRLSFRWVP